MNALLDGAGWVFGVIALAFLGAGVLGTYAERRAGEREAEQL